MSWLAIESGLWYLAASMTAVVSFFNVLIVLLTGKTINNAIRVKYLLYASALMIWSANVFAFSIVRDQSVAYFCNQLLHFAAIFIPVFLMDFVLTFFNIRTKKNLIEFYIIYVLAIGFSIANIFFPTSFTLDVIPKRNYPYFLTPGILYGWWVGLFLYTVISAHIKVLKCYLRTTGEERKRLGLFVFPSLVAYLGCIAYFLPVYDMFVFPYPWGCFGAMILSSALLYGILRHKLLGVDLVIRKTLVFAGLFGIILAVVTGVSAFMQEIVGKVFALPTKVSTMLSVVVAIALFDPSRQLLLNVTDRFLFQKKEDIKIVLNKLARNIITILDLKKLGETILVALQTSLRAESGAIIIKDEDGESFRILDAFGVGNREIVFGQFSPFTEYCAENDRAINLEDPQINEAIPENVMAQMEVLKPAIILPLFIHGELMGMLVLGKKRSDQNYNQEEMDFFPTIVSQIAVAISNARLYEILKKSQINFAQQAKMAAIGTLSAGISHEIKNPLNHIKVGIAMLRMNKKHGLFDQMERYKMEEEVFKTLDILDENVTRANEVIERLSSFAKKPKEQKIEEVDIEKAVDMATSFVKNELDHNSIEIDKQIGHEFPGIKADLHTLEDIILNLIVNARHAIGHHGKITILGIVDSDFAELVVKDTGRGIAKENLERIFDPFFTTKDVSRNPDKGAVKGSGLGLFIVREFIQRFGGNIHVESEVGEGTEFHITFPKDVWVEQQKVS